MADHFTRLSLTSPSTPTLGVLYSPCSGELTDCDDLPFSVDSAGVAVIDKEKLDLVARLHTEVFPKDSIGGLYRVGSSPPGAEDLDLLSSLAKLLGKEDLLFVRLNPDKSDADVGVEVYNRGAGIFLQADFDITTESAEAVAITNVIANRTVAGNSKILPQIRSLSSAVSDMSSRTDTLLNYLSQVHSGALPPDPSLLRSISTLLSQASTAAPPAGAADGDAAAEVYLAAVAKGAEGMRCLAEKVQERMA